MMLLCSKGWLEPSKYRLVVTLCLPLQCLLFFFILPHNPEELMESLCLFRQCQHSTHTHTHFHSLSLSLPLSLSLSLLLPHEVNIFCRKADGELVLTTSRSASQSLQSSRQLRCVSVASAYACVCVCNNACVHVCVTTVWHLHGRFIPHRAPSIIQ